MISYHDRRDIRPFSLHSPTYVAAEPLDVLKHLYHELGRLDARIEGGRVAKLLDDIEAYVGDPFTRSQISKKHVRPTKRYKPRIDLIFYDTGRHNLSVVYHPTDIGLSTDASDWEQWNPYQPAFERPTNELAFFHDAFWYGGIESNVASVVETALLACLADLTYRIHQHFTVTVVNEVVIETTPVHDGFKLSKWWLRNVEEHQRTLTEAWIKDFADAEGLPFADFVAMCKETVTDLYSPVNEGHVRKQLAMRGIAKTPSDIKAMVARVENHYGNLARKEVSYAHPWRDPSTLAKVSVAPVVQ